MDLELSQKILTRKVKVQKSTLVNSLLSNRDVEAALAALVETNIELTEKLHVVDICDLVKMNCRSCQDVKELQKSLQLLGDFGRNLCAKHDGTYSDADRRVGVNSGPLAEVFKMQGAKVILFLLGFTEEFNGKLQIPRGAEPSSERIAMATADLLVASEETILYLNKNHPHPDCVAEIFPKGLRDFEPQDDCDKYVNVKFSPKPPKPFKVLTNPDSSQPNGSVDSPPKPMGPQTWVTGTSKKGPPVFRKPTTERISALQIEYPQADMLHSRGQGAKLEQTAVQPLTPSTMEPRCHICGGEKPCIFCRQCGDKNSFCEECDTSWHSHSKRQDHVRGSISRVQGSERGDAEPEVPISRSREQRETDAVFRPKHEILRRKPNVVGQDRGSSRGSVVVVPGKRKPLANQSVSIKSKRQTDPTLIYSLASEVEPDEVETENGASDDRRNDSESYMNMEFPNEHRGEHATGGETPPTNREKFKPILVPGIATGSPLNTSSIINDFEAESDLHRRKVKVATKLSEIGQQLGSITSGLKRVSVMDRIHLMKEQDLLQGYKERLDSKIQRETSIPKKNGVTQPRGNMNEIRSKIEATFTCGKSEKEKDPDYVYDTEIHPTSPQGNTTFIDPRGLPFDASTIEHTAAHGHFYTLQKSEAEASGAYEDIEIPSKPRPEPHTLPKKTTPANQNHEPLTMTKSEPTFPSIGASTAGWPKKWECEHCTLFNKRGTRICKACCKTSDNPNLLEDIDEDELPLPNMDPGRPLPSLPPDSVLSPLSPEIQGLLKGILMLQKRYSVTINRKKTDEELLKDLNSKFQDSSVNIFYPPYPPAKTRTSPEAKIKKPNVLDSERHARRLLGQLKEADKSSFTYEEFELALASCGAVEPVDWLQSEWTDRVNTVISSSNKQLKKLHPKAQLGQKEARLGLINAKGVISKAVSLGVDTFKANYNELLANLCQGTVPTELQKDLVVLALKQSEGDISDASVNLFHITQAPKFKVGIWGEVPTGEVGSDRPHDKVADTSLDLERRIRMLMAEFGLDTWEKGHNVIRILDREAQILKTSTTADVIEAVKNCSTITAALKYLQQDCGICHEKFPASKIQVLSFCQCKLCVGCLKQYFLLAIKERQVRDLVCPLCREPDVSQVEQFELHMQLLTLMLNHLLTPGDMNLLDEKLRDWNLMQEPNFRWCPYDDCRCGFVFNQHGELKMDCPDCQRATCFSCKKQWDDEHTKMTCEQFEEWRIYQDPGTYTQGLARLLKDNGIDCPQCRYRYAISKGGCMHFTCSQCGHEFCSGCSKPFARGASCKVALPLCAQSGLHCHHPRSCLYYLRNESVENLQKLLRQNSVSYNTEPPGGEASKQRLCQVPELRDNDTADEACGKQIESNHAGLCELHYKEYLVGLINQRSLDPVVIMRKDELKLQFSRVGKEAPKQTNGEDLTAYMKRLIKAIQQQIPLPKYQKKPSIVH